jgi:predicted PurR-regulated permease PerM
MMLRTATPARSMAPTVKLVTSRVPKLGFLDIESFVAAGWRAVKLIVEDGNYKAIRHFTTVRSSELGKQRAWDVGNMTVNDDSGLAHEARALERRADSALKPDVDVGARAQPAEPGAKTPDIEQTGAAMVTPRAHSIEATLLSALAVLYTLYFARSFLIPIVFAILLNFLLSPLIRLLGRFHFKPPIAAAVVVLLLLGGVGGAAYELAGPAQGWVAMAPQSFGKAQTKLRKIIRPMQQVSRSVEQAADSVGGPTGKSAPRVVVQSGPTLSSRLFGTTQRLAAGMVEVFILLYFLLAGGDLFLQKLIKVLPHFSDKVKAVEIARATESAVSAYLTTTLIVNVAEGSIVAFVLWMLGMPNVLLWGALVACLEFVPYLGALTAIVVFTLAGLSAFPDIGHALLIPGSFLAINLLQANLATPLLLGHRLTLNPVAIFIGLAFFFWIWGVAGAFLAVPLLATFKIFCDHITSLAAIGEFLGQRDENERRVTARI